MLPWPLEILLLSLPHSNLILRGLIITFNRLVKKHKVYIKLVYMKNQEEAIAGRTSTVARQLVPSDKLQTIISSKEVNGQRQQVILNNKEHKHLITRDDH